MATSHPVEGGRSAVGQDEASTAVGINHLRLEYEGDSDGGSEQEEMAPSDGGDEEERYSAGETVPRRFAATDRDDDDEETREIVEVLDDIREEQRHRRPGSAEEEEPTVDTKTYEEAARAILAVLPTGRDVVIEVVKDVLEECSEHADFVLPLANKLSARNCLGAPILSWWEFLVGLLRKGVGKPPDSRRVAAFSSQRRRARPGKMQEFLGDDRIYATAIDVVGDEDEAVLQLGVVSNLVDKATWHFLADEITKVNILRVEYPTARYDLDQDRREVLYFLSGWLLSSALSHVTRHKRDGPAFTSFVNSHKYENAAQFVRANPRLKGLEKEVDRRNVKWRGLSLLFADASFYEFAYTLENGYLHALKKPALFATYQGDLPAKIMEVVSSAAAVKRAFRLCVDSIREDAGKGAVMVSFDVLFDFFVLKWHNMRMADYAKKLSNAQRVVKQKKREKVAEKGGEKGALRDRLKSMVNKKSGVRTEPREPTSPERRTRVELADAIGSREFRGLTNKELSAHIQACGGVVTGRERQYDLRSMLRAIAPGVGEDVDPAFLGHGKEGEATQIALQAFQAFLRAQR